MLGLLALARGQRRCRRAGRRPPDRRPLLRPLPRRQAAPAGRHRLDRDEPGTGSWPLSPSRRRPGRNGISSWPDRSSDEFAAVDAEGQNRWPAIICAGAWPERNSTACQSHGGRAFTRCLPWPSWPGSAATIRFARRSRTSGGASPGSTGTTTAASRPANRLRATRTTREPSKRAARSPGWR